MRFNEFNEDLQSSWHAKPAIDSDEYIAKPAYQRAGKPDPYAADVSAKMDKLQAQQGKPKVDIKDVQRQRELQKTLSGDPRPAVWKDPRTGNVSKSPPSMDVAPPARPAVSDPVGSMRPGAPFKPTYSLANDPVGKMTPGEPTMGTTPPAVWKNNRNPNAAASTSPISQPTKPATTSAPSQYQQAMNTVSNIRKGMGKGSEYTNIYAPLGPTSFQNKQYVKDLEKEFAKTPNDANIRAELDRMRAPGIVAAKGTGNAGGRTTDVNDPRLSADIRPGSSDIRGTGRGPGMKDDPRLSAQSTTTPAVKPPASTGTSAPAQSGYKGSAGAQAIQQANPDKIKDINKIRAGDVIKVGGQDYTIKPGDTLDKIAKSQQTTTAPTLPAADAFPNTTNGVGSVLNPSKPDVKPTTSSDDNETERQKLIQRIQKQANDSYDQLRAQEPTNEESNTIHRIKSLAGLK